MEETTFKNPAVKKLLTTKFYFISIDAEEKKDIVFNGKVFKFKPTGIRTGIHDLAEQLGTIKGNVTYPAVCFLNERNEIIYQVAEYIKASHFKNILEQVSAM